MKLLRIIATITPDTGGPIEGLKRASRVMSEMGVDVEVVCLDPPGAFQEEVDKLPWVIHREGAMKRTYYGYSRRFNHWINAHVRDYDAVIIHCMWQYHGIAASRACRRHKVPYFIYPHGMLDPWFNESYPLKKLKKNIYWRLFEHSVVANATAVLFTCEEECRRARMSFSPYRVKEKVIGYGTEVPEIDFRANPSSTPQCTSEWGKRPYLLFMGRIQEKKGVDLLIEAYSSLRKEMLNPPDLVIAGHQQQPDYVEHLKTDFPQEGIHWPGLLIGADKWQAVHNAEALVLVSHQENFGLVVAEALAVGTPVLISDQVNIWREIEQSGAGLVEPDTLDGAYKLLRQWFSLDSATRATMSKKAQTTFHEHFEIRSATERLVAYIDSVIHPEN